MAFRIGLDLDGVCYNWVDHAMFLLRTRCGYTLEDLPGAHAQVSHNWFSSRVRARDIRWLWGDGLDSLFGFGEEYGGLRPAVSHLSSVGHLHVITHRPERALARTLAWVAAKMPFVRSVNMLWGGEPKSSVPCDVYIDDSEHVVAELMAAGRRAIVFDRPWNQNADPRAIRVKTWDECISAVERIKRDLQCSDPN